MRDAPRYRLWPPFALGIPLVLGIAATATVHDPFTLPSGFHIVGWLLVAAFAAWNGWTLAAMWGNRTAVLPGGEARTILNRGPFGRTRNPLYLGLITLDVAIGLLWPSVWALALVPVGVVALTWGAITPEESYLHAKFPTEYAAYTHRVRRWL